MEGNISESVSAISFHARIKSVWRAVVPKLFAGVLGLEYEIPYANGGVKDFDNFSMGGGAKKLQIALSTVISIGNTMATTRHMLMGFYPFI